MTSTYKHLKAPVAVQIELTPRCNNSCEYCYNSWRGDFKMGPELKLQDYLSIGQKMIENEVFEVVLTGGEPLLKKEVVYPLANYLSSNGIDVKLNTNLTKITEEDCK